MDTIYKYHIPNTLKATEIEMPINAIIRMANYIETNLFIWAQVDPNFNIIPAKKETRTFIVVGTGDVVNPKWIHIKSFVVHRFNEVYHAYEIPKE